MIKRGIWCPTKHCVEPPIYGDSILKKYKHRQKSNNLPSTKLNNTPRSDRSNVEEKKVKGCKDSSWRKSKPRGTTICFDPISVRRDAAISKQMHLCKRNLEISGQGKKKDFCTLKPSPSVSFWMPPGHCSRNVIPQNKRKMYYNVMWDPRVCRGPTSVNIAEHQKEKCRRELDLNRWLDFKARVRKRKEKGGGLLDRRSNPIGKILYPTVTVQKQPLTYNSFSQFLVEQSDGTEYVDKAQCMAKEENINEKVAYNKGITVWEGTGVQTQTDIEPCKLDTENFIVDTMVDKIPQQALLECIEECDLEVLKGERQRYEMVFLFRKWQQMKEDQWNDWLYAWNEIRMNAILKENSDIEEKAERIFASAFARNAIDTCFSETARLMKIDGFINEHGVPYEEIEEVRKILDLDHETHKKFHESTKMSTKIMDSVVTQAVVQRFASHMHDGFGRPHGKWVRRTQPVGRESVDYDMDLQKYLEGRWVVRREGPLGSNVIQSIRTDFGLGDVFRKSQDEDKRDSEMLRMYNLFDIRKLEKNWQSKEGKRDSTTAVPPPSPSDSFIRSTNKTESKAEVRTSYPRESFAVLFKRESGSLDYQGGENRKSSGNYDEIPKSES